MKITKKQLVKLIKEQQNNKYSTSELNQIGKMKIDKIKLKKIISEQTRTTREQKALKIQQFLNNLVNKFDESEQQDDIRFCLKDPEFARKLSHQNFKKLLSTNKYKNESDLILHAVISWCNNGYLSNAFGFNEESDVDYKVIERKIESILTADLLSKKLIDMKTKNFLKSITMHIIGKSIEKGLTIEKYDRILRIIEKL